MKAIRLLQAALLLVAGGWACGAAPDREKGVIPSNPPSGAPTTLAYDADKALTTFSQPAGQTIAIGYDAADRPVTRTLTTGAITDATGSLSTALNFSVAVLAAGAVLAFFQKSLRE